MLEWISNYDKKALLYINGMHSPTWDNIMWWLSQEKFFWVPLYLFLLCYIIYRERSALHIIFIILFLVVLVTLTDQISGLIKFLVERPRPTHDPEIDRKSVV